MMDQNGRNSGQTKSGDGAVNRIGGGCTGPGDKAIQPAVS
ncbi:hypothetical protein SDC9_192645 [bioreactor metagenome]|uniref:Uncharacterized protein n=1 Tax=bioreactor metagenome TaxID=1076179 RepID=A0A645I1F2_9ZZZZ